MRILIISMSSWGELGNWLSGSNLAEFFRKSLPDSEVLQLKAEEIFPLFGKIGSEIKVATLQATNPKARFEGYSAVLNSYEKYFDSIDLEGSNPDLDNTRNAIKEFEPDVAIGTKGVICKVLLAALKQLGSDVPVINYVTNHGIFQFKLHHCHGARLHVVRFEDSKEYLLHCTKFNADDIINVGYLLNSPDKVTIDKTVAIDQIRSEYSVVIMSNRGGKDYLMILEYLLKNHPMMNVLFLAINDPEMCEAANQLILDFGAVNFQVKQEVSQKEFMAIMLSFRKKGPTIYISKASPNAIFEAVYLNMPCMLLRSGLPMEEWAVDKVLNEGLGTVDDCISDLLETMKLKLNDRSSIEEIIGNQKIFRSRYLDQPSVRAKVINALQRALS